jgi:diacylglycerol kinase
MKKQPFYKAISNAFCGMKYFFLHERNGRLQLVASVFAIALAVGFEISKTELLITIVCCAVVISLEMVNTAIENLCNLVQEEYHPTIKTIKDVSASAVMLVSIASIAIAAIIYLPKLF